MLNQLIIQKLIKEKKGEGLGLRGADLEGVDLRNAKLKCAVLRDANLRGANLENADLENVNFGGANLEDVNLKVANLEGADLVNANLENANMENVNLGDTILVNANLEKVNLISANLVNAILRGAVLKGANLRNANLRNANLEGADMRGADLENANLKGTIINYEPDLYILKYQPPNTLLRAFKFLKSNWTSPYQGFSYKDKIGKWLEAGEYSTDERIDCDKGFNVATLYWCKQSMSEDDIIVQVEFYAKDIVAIPLNADGKFRVRRMRIIGEYKEGKCQKRKSCIKGKR